jgi:ATP-dependent Clp protease, protease subunit
MKSWFSIQAKGSTAEIVIYDEVGLFGISAKQFNDQLKALGPVSTIVLRVNSPGGDVWDGIAIFNMLKRHPARVEVIVDGIAASIASVIAMAGDRIKMPSNSFMFIHDPLAVVLGDAENMREMADSLDKVAAALVSTYMNKTGKSEEEVKKWMAGDTWFTAQEALEAGLADEVIESVAIAARFDLGRFRNTPAAVAKLLPEPVASGVPPQNPHSNSRS